MRPLTSSTLRFALAALLAAPAALAQTPVALAPGHPDLATEALDLRTHTMDVRLVTPMEADLGTIAETVTHHDDGTVSIARVIDLELPGGRGGQQQQDEGRYAWPSLAPLAHTSYDIRDGDTEEVTFDGTHVTGTYGEDGAEPLPFDLTLDAPAFGPGSMTFVARAVPLTEGYTATVPTFTAEDRLEHATLTVGGTEDVTVGETTVAAVVVEVATGGHQQRYFVDPATRDLVRMTVAPGPGALIVATPR